MFTFFYLVPTYICLGVLILYQKCPKLFSILQGSVEKMLKVDLILTLPFLEHEMGGHCSGNF